MQADVFLFKWISSDENSDIIWNTLVETTRLYTATSWINIHRSDRSTFVLRSSQEKGEGEEIVDMYLAGCARDSGKDIATFGRQDLLELLKKKQGRIKYDE